ncbi:DUF547 domain-containing protein [Flavicella sediminum]|uniref:DUF547 domain-containing protein n=1 Tax=Flavicella sediminum TaxID=2585141 RepID=UPI0011228148|nr:DUF547 domain-containing protein [Flavicella sediminum]
MKLHLYAIILLLFTSQLSAQVAHFDSLLKENISNEGVVNYQGIIKNKHHLAHYIDYLKKTTPAKSWSDNAVKAFWINAYNAYTIKLITDHYPVKSIMDIRLKGKDAWHAPIATVGGKTLTLNEIEHEILRKNYKDPRIHVGVNCASFSCPPIANFAFTEKNIEATLEKLMVSFVNDPQRNNITEKKITLSKIFEWYQADFTQNGNLVSYISKYSKTPISKKAKVRYLDYNWNLNE